MRRGRQWEADVERQRVILANALLLQVIEQCEGRAAAQAALERCLDREDTAA